jgi:hypothetical protein
VLQKHGRDLSGTDELPPPLFRVCPAILSKANDSRWLYRAFSRFKPPSIESLKGRSQSWQHRRARISYPDWLCFPLWDRLVYSFQISTHEPFWFTALRYTVSSDLCIAFGPNGNMPFSYPILIFVLAAEHGEISEALVEPHRL